MTDPQMGHKDVLRLELQVFLREHRDLDLAIDALSQSPTAETLTIRRFKKKKLALKDQIARIADQLTPDIIA